MSLVDIVFRGISEEMLTLLKVISRGADPMPQRLQKGLYLAQNWNFGDFITPEPSHDQSYREVKASPRRTYFAYGVCDSPAQFMRTVGKALEADPRKFVVSLVRIRADAQSPEGGWRWKKWGEYVGDGKPTTEYIYDEPVLREVYTYHFYEVGP